MRLGIGLSTTSILSRGLGGVLNTLPAAPAVSVFYPPAYLGISSADMRAPEISGTRRLTLPATANTVQTDGSDWYAVLYCNTSDHNHDAQWETLAAADGSYGSGSSSRNISLLGKAYGSSMGWKWGVEAKNVGFNLFTGLTPALTTASKAQFGHYVVVMGVSNFKPYIGIQRAGDLNPTFSGVAPDIRFMGGYYVAGSGSLYRSTGTLERSGGVMTYRLASSPSGWTAGLKIFIESPEHPEVNGFYTIASRLASSAGFTVAAPGADFAITAANNKVNTPRAAHQLFKTLGAQTDPTVTNGPDFRGWGGAVGPYAFYYGTMPITNDLIDADWLRDLSTRSATSMPGTKVYGNACSPANNYAADADGTITTAITPVGTPMLGIHHGTDWLQFAHRDPIPPFASDFNTSNGTSTGTFRTTVTSKYKTGQIYGTLKNAAGTTIVAETKLSNGCAAGGNTELVMSGIPNGRNYYMHIRALKEGFNMVYGPFGVGPNFAWISQSTIATLFLPSDGGGTGNDLNPVVPPVGMGLVGDVVGTISDSSTNASGDNCRYGTIPLEVNGSTGDGMMGFANTIIGLQNTATGRESTVGVYNLCRSGHPAQAYWADRRQMVNSIGTASAGVAKTGTWNMFPGISISDPYTKYGTAKLYRGGTLAKIEPGVETSLYQLTGGTLIATCSTAYPSGSWIAEGGSGVTGTFNYDTGAYSVTDPVGGDLYIEATAHFDTGAGSTGLPRRMTDFTVWGSDTIDDSGHISNLFKQGLPRQTAFIWSWANYLLSSSLLSQAELNARVSLDINMVRRRIEDNYPQHAGTPWIIAADARTCSTDSNNEHRIRLALRAYAMSTPNTYYSIGPITGEMEYGSNSPHPGPAAASGQLWGITFAHGVATACNMAGAKGQEYTLTGVQRAVDGSYWELTFNNPEGTQLTCANTAKVDGLYMGASNDTATMSCLDTYNGTYYSTVPAYNKVRIFRTDTAPVAASSWWNINVGFAIYTNADGLDGQTSTDLDTDRIRLANTLHLDNGGYSGIRPGTPIMFSPTNIQATQA